MTQPMPGDATQQLLAGSGPPPLPAEGMPTPGALGGMAASPVASPVAAPVASPAEEAWKQDRDFNQESTFMHVGSGLLVGGGLATDLTGAGKALRMGRNLLSEAEHASGARAARDLVKSAGRGEAGASADDIARLSPDDPAVAYLRDNAEPLTDELATKQAKAAQTLLDTYRDVSSLRPSVDEVSARIPDNLHDQARWVAHTRDALEAHMADVPTDVAAPLLERLSELGEGANPAEWFTRGSELSDELLRAASKAPEAAEAIGAARRAIDSGLGDGSIWGKAARDESQRSAGLAERYGEHIDEFEREFAPDGKAAPAAFRALLAGGEKSQALEKTLESARATADVAAKYGKTAESTRILGAIAELEKTSAQGGALRAAGGVARETAVQDGLDFLGRAPEQTGSARDAVFRAAHRLAKQTSAGIQRGVAGLLSSPRGADERGAEGMRIAAPEAPAVTALNFDATRDHIDKMARDPNYFGSVMAASFGRMPEAAPEVYQALAAQTAKVVQYLSAVAPGGESGGPFSQRIPVADDELWEWNERFRGTADPEYIQTQLGSGQLSSQAVESFQAMSPRAFGKLQQDVFERLAHLKKLGVQIPIQAREQLDVLLDLDGGGEPGMTWQAAERASAGQALKHPSAGMGKPTGDASEGMTSGALASLHNGASAIAQT